jgi:hypothetical protein
MVRAVNECPLLTVYVASRYLGQYSYAFKSPEQASLQLFERYEVPPHNSSQLTRLPDGDFGTALETAAAIGFLRNYKLIEHFTRAAGSDYHVFLQPEVVFEDDHRLRAADRAIKATTERLYALSGSS